MKIFFTQLNRHLTMCKISPFLPNISAEKGKDKPVAKLTLPKCWSIGNLKVNFHAYIDLKRQGGSVSSNNTAKNPTSRS
jgi:hypothetical protein